MREVDELALFEVELDKIPSTLPLTGFLKNSILAMVGRENEEICRLDKKKKKKKMDGSFVSQEQSQFQ